MNEKTKPKSKENEKYVKLENSVMSSASQWGNDDDKTEKIELRVIIRQLK